MTVLQDISTGFLDRSLLRRRDISDATAGWLRVQPLSEMAGADREAREEMRAERDEEINWTPDGPARYTPNPAIPVTVVTILCCRHCGGDPETCGCVR